MSIALDVGIGVVFLYLLLALTVTICQELLTTVLASRAKHLYGAIAGMLEGPGKDGNGLVRKFYEHPLIRKSTRAWIARIRTKFVQSSGRPEPANARARAARSEVKATKGLVGAKRAPGVDESVAAWNRACSSLLGLARFAICKDPALSEARLSRGRTSRCPSSRPCPGR